MRVRRLAVRLVGCVCLVGFLAGTLTLMGLRLWHYDQTDLAVVARYWELWLATMLAGIAGVGIALGSSR